MKAENKNNVLRMQNKEQYSKCHMSAFLKIKFYVKGILLATELTQGAASPSAISLHFQAVSDSWM